MKRPTYIALEENGKLTPVKTGTSIHEAFAEALKAVTDKSEELKTVIEESMKLMKKLETLQKKAKPVKCREWANVRLGFRLGAIRLVCTLPKGHKGNHLDAVWRKTFKNKKGSK